MLQGYLKSEAYCGGSTPVLNQARGLTSPTPAGGGDVGGFGFEGSLGGVRPCCLPVALLGAQYG